MGSNRMPTIRSNVSSYLLQPLRSLAQYVAERGARPGSKQSEPSLVGESERAVIKPESQTP